MLRSCVVSAQRRRRLPPRGLVLKVRVLVRLKPGILDVQGAAVRRALGGLGFNDVAEIRIGKVIEVDVDATSVVDARGRVDEMCRKLLANPLLEDYVIE